MSAIHLEERLECEICDDLAVAGWLYTRPTSSEISPDAKLYDRDHALFPGDLQTWLETTQVPQLEQ